MLPGLVLKGVAMYMANKGKKKEAKRRAKQTNDIADQIFGRQQNIISSDLSGLDNTIDRLSQMEEGMASEMMKSYFDTNEGNAFLDKISEYGRTSSNKLRNDASLMGLSDEAYLAGLNNINKSQGSAIASLSAGSDARKRDLRSGRMGILGAINATRMNKAGLLSGMYNNAYGNANNILQGVDARRQAYLNAITGSIDEASNTKNAIATSMASMGGA